MRYIRPFQQPKSQMWPRRYLGSSNTSCWAANWGRLQALENRRRPVRFLLAALLLAELLKTASRLVASLRDPCRVRPVAAELEPPEACRLVTGPANTPIRPRSSSRHEPVSRLVKSARLRNSKESRPRRMYGSFRWLRKSRDRSRETFHSCGSGFDRN